MYEVINQAAAIFPQIFGIVTLALGISIYWTFRKALGDPQPPTDIESKPKRKNDAQAETEWKLGDDGEIIMIAQDQNEQADLAAK